MNNKADTNWSRKALQFS